MQHLLPSAPTPAAHARRYDDILDEHIERQRFIDEHLSRDRDEGLDYGLEL